MVQTVLSEESPQRRIDALRSEDPKLYNLFYNHQLAHVRGRGVYCWRIAQIYCQYARLNLLETYYQVRDQVREDLNIFQDRRGGGRHTAKPTAFRNFEENLDKLEVQGLMSIKVMSYVMDNVTAKCDEKLILLALADWANDNGWCYPVQTEIARKACMSVRQVQRKLTKLAKLGVIEKVTEQVSTNKRRNTYRICTECGVIDLTQVIKKKNGDSQSALPEERPVSHGPCSADDAVKGLQEEELPDKPDLFSSGDAPKYRGTVVMDLSWQPSEMVLEYLSKMRGVDRDFAKAQILEFAFLARGERERGNRFENRFSWYVVRQWEKSKCPPTRIPSDFQPAPIYVEALQEQGIDEVFIAQALDDYVLYWVGHSPMLMLDVVILNKALKHPGLIPSSKDLEFINRIDRQRKRSPYTKLKNSEHKWLVRIGRQYLDIYPELYGPTAEVRPPGQVERLKFSRQRAVLIRFNPGQESREAKLVSVGQCTLDEFLTLERRRVVDPEMLRHEHMLRQGRILIRSHILRQKFFLVVLQKAEFVPFRVEYMSSMGRIDHYELRGASPLFRELEQSERMPDYELLIQHRNGKIEDVACHIQGPRAQWFGKGKGIKPDDDCVAFLCRDCHEFMDRYRNGKVLDLRGSIKTTAELIESIEDDEALELLRSHLELLLEAEGKYFNHKEVTQCPPQHPDPRRFESAPITHFVKPQPSQWEQEQLAKAEALLTKLNVSANNPLSVRGTSTSKLTSNDVWAALSMMPMTRLVDHPTWSQVGLKRARHIMLYLQIYKYTFVDDRLRDVNAHAVLFQNLLDLLLDRKLQRNWTVRRPKILENMVLTVIDHVCDPKSFRDVRRYGKAEDQEIVYDHRSLDDVPARIWAKRLGLSDRKDWKLRWKAAMKNPNDITMLKELPKEMQEAMEKLRDNFVIAMVKRNGGRMEFPVHEIDNASGPLTMEIDQNRKVFILTITSFNGSEANEIYKHLESEGTIVEQGMGWRVVGLNSNTDDSDTDSKVITTEDLRETLLDTLKELRAGTIDVKQAKAVSDMAGKIIDTAKLELAHNIASKKYGGDLAAPVKLLDAN
ncbi:unnamed protein product [Symbiodinium microadriaticum]|nr:unnamed protein product [Symbiodinium microadriaticum]